MLWGLCQSIPDDFYVLIIEKLESLSVSHQYQTVCQSLVGNSILEKQVTTELECRVTNCFFSYYDWFL